MYYSVEPENFMRAKKYINNINRGYGVDLSRPVCLDQPFEMHKFSVLQINDDPYAVVIDRDQNLY